VIEGNPVHEEALAVAKTAGVDFIVNVTLDSEKKVTGVFAGDLERAWETGVEFLAPQVTATVREPVDIVVTTAAGYPLDKTMYQSIKGLQHALAVLKPGGSIVLASEMSEGIGTEAFTELMLETDDLQRFFDECLMDPDYFHVDQWMFESVVRVGLRAKVYCMCDGIDDQTLSRCFMTPVSSVEEGIRNALSDHGPHAKIAVIPQGPYVIGKVA
jgi:nickel-dependent lactate racemase